MRTFLVLLLLANLGYLAWQQGWLFARESAPLVVEPPAFRQADQSLVLLSELPQERLDMMASLTQALAARENAAAELQAVQQEIATVEGKIDEVQADIDEDRQQSTEVQGAMLEALDAAIAEVAPAAETVPWCASAGVFADQQTVDAFIASLQGLGVRGVGEAREEPLSSTWWVHMPAFESEAAAMAMLDELQAKSIDSYYMRSGDMAGGISLGVYSRQESALIAQQQLTNRGYATSIREVSRMGERLYVAVTMPDGALRETPEWTEFLASAGGVEVSENACEMIAPENQFP